MTMSKLNKLLKVQISKIFFDACLSGFIAAAIIGCIFGQLDTKNPNAVTIILVVIGTINAIGSVIFYLCWNYFESQKEDEDDR